MLGILIGNQANGELADDLLWNDSLGSGLVEGTLNTVNGEAGITPSGLQQPSLVALVRQIIGAYIFPNRWTGRKGALVCDLRCCSRLD